MLISPAIVVPFCKGINGRASTFSKEGEKADFSLKLRCFPYQSEMGQLRRRREKYPTSAKLLRDLEEVWQFHEFVWYGGVGGRRSVRTMCRD